MAAARPDPVVFLATGAAGDDEMTARIERHRAERPAEWTTIEEPIHLSGALERSPAGATVVIDCLTLWLANVVDWDDNSIEAHAVEAAQTAARRDGLSVAVSNEVGSGIVPVDAGVRRYRDLLGRVNAVWAGAADEAWLVVAGRVLPLASPDHVVDG
jgi:adenosyl cobinamide kinase/adenosyl cobinamide phosphate guanylyltransferase